jgi:hypothetical protein
VLILAALLARRLAVGAALRGAGGQAARASPGVLQLLLGVPLLRRRRRRRRAEQRLAQRLQPLLALARAALQADQAPRRALRWRGGGRWGER